MSHSRDYDVDVIGVEYNSPVAQTLKVDRRAFEAVVSRLLNTPAMPKSEISPKRKRKQKPATKHG